MTTVWLLLLLLVLVISRYSVDSQSTSDDETCSDGGLLCKLQRDMERILDNQQQLSQQHQSIMDRLGKLQRNRFW